MEEAQPSASMPEEREASSPSLGFNAEDDDDDEDVGDMDDWGLDEDDEVI